MKPEWSSAPSWAWYLVQDQSGGWWWYEKHPHPGVNGWENLYRGNGRIEPVNVNPNWKDSLERHPKLQKVIDK